MIIMFSYFSYNLCRAGFVDRYCLNLDLYWNVFLSSSIVIEHFSDYFCSKSPTQICPGNENTTQLIWIHAVCLDWADLLLHYHLPHLWDPLELAVSPGHVLLLHFSSSSFFSVSSLSLPFSPFSLPLIFCSTFPFICPIISSPLFYKLRWEAGLQEITWVLTHSLFAAPHRTELTSNTIIHNGL